MFEDALRNASRIFGYRVSLPLSEYRALYEASKISPEVLTAIVQDRMGSENLAYWFERLLSGRYDEHSVSKVGQLRALWKGVYHLDLNTIVHTNLFRILNSYLDQGIAINKFPYQGGGFLDALRELERQSYVSFFKTKNARAILLEGALDIGRLLDLLVGDESYYEQYLFDQQFAHPGWSGLVAMIEEQPQSLMDKRVISLGELVFLELLLELDNLDYQLGKRWKPLATHAPGGPIDLFAPNEVTEYDHVMAMWQKAYEWSYYDEVLCGIAKQQVHLNGQVPSFQAFFCIDDRECSIRRHLSHADSACATFGTPGHFGVDAYYQPKNALFYTKVCPAPISPKHLVKEVSTKRENSSDVHFIKTTHSLFRGWLITQTLGFWSAIKLMFNIFKPSLSPASSSSFTHMDEFSSLTVENRSPHHIEHGLQVGYTVEEMADRVEGVLKSTGLVDHFSPLVYIIGHGASSANNTHYAGYDCGACSGRPGSANARAFSYMANHRQVREILRLRGVSIPKTTEFVGALHDTTRDEIAFYDEELLSPANKDRHKTNQLAFQQALRANAKERSRRLMSIDTSAPAEVIHQEVKKRSMSLFEPRPELNHATNSLCIIGRKHLNSQLFLDRRAFLNSYNYQVDPDGKFLQSIVNAAVPVCGGINLEYYFSRVDNEKLGAGSKLPHNVMGLIGVANGFEGDLRPGLPMQMVEVHDPVRLMMIIEHYPEVVLRVIQSSAATYEWIANEWVWLSVVHPDSREVYRFANGQFEPYDPLKGELKSLSPGALMNELVTHEENLPVYQLSEK